MSSRKRTCKRPCYRGSRWIRQKFWSRARTAGRTQIKRGVEPDPPRHRHNEKWDRE